MRVAMAVRPVANCYVLFSLLTYSRPVTGRRTSRGSTWSCSSCPQSSCSSVMSVSSPRSRPVFPILLTEPGETPAKNCPFPWGIRVSTEAIGPTRVSICTEISSKAAGRSTSVTHANSDDARQPVDIELTFIPVRHKVSIIHSLGGSVAEWLACWTQAQYGLGSNRSRDAVG